MDHLIKANTRVSRNRLSLSSQLIVLLFIVNSIYLFTKESSGDIFSKHFFASIFVNFYKILAVHQKKKMFRKFLESRETLEVKSCFCKVAGFHRSSHRRSFVKNVLLEILQNPQENIYARDCILIKLQD